MNRTLQDLKSRVRSSLYEYSAKLAYLSDDDDWIVDKIQHVAEVLQRAVELGENLIMLVRGQPSSGKTYLVRSSIAQVLRNPQNRSESSKSRHTHVVELCAYVYRDDIKCMRALLDQLEALVGSNKDSDAHMLVSQIQTRILHCLKLLRRNNMYLIVVIDGFELFTKGIYDCSVTTGSCSRRQGLLYFLSDSMQLRETAFAVLYVTSDLNCLDRMEKRVKSRFVYEPVYCFSDYDVTEYFNDRRESTKVMHDCLVLVDKEKFASMAQDSICGRDRNLMSIDASIALLMMKDEVKAPKGKKDAKVQVLLKGEPSEENVVFEHLSIPDHFILVSLSRLHVRGVYPQTLNAVIEDLKRMVAHFPKEKYAIPKPEGLRRSFLDLVNMGLIEWVNYSQNNIDNVRVQHSVNDPSGYLMPCRFAKYREYMKLTQKDVLPSHLSQWLSMADRTL